MFSGKYTHVRDIIERIYRAYPFEEVFEDEVKEHVYDALNYIGRQEFFEDAIDTITIADFKGILPDNIAEGGVLGVREYNTKTVMIPSKDIFMHQNQSSLNGSTSGIVMGASWEAEYTEDTMIGDSVTLTENNVLVEPVNGKTNPTNVEQFVYRVNDRYIFTGFRTGTIEISYKAFPVWSEDGSPKIPDDSKVVRMLVSYISMKIATKLLFKGKLNKQLFDIIEQDYLFDVGSARNRLVQPDLAELESIKRSQMRLLPKPNQFATGFKNINEQERLRGN